MSDRIILDLCGGTGAWSKPYADASYDVRLVTLPEHDVLTYQPPLHVHGILAAPPCTEFAASGARWWAGKAPHLLIEARQIVRRCLAIILASDCKWWALENPVGRIRRIVPELGHPSLSFHPCDYGDPWTKKTLLWGMFNIPIRNPVEPTANKFPGSSPIHRCPPGPERKKIRSQTPTGFARAFFEANP